MKRVDEHHETISRNEEQLCALLDAVSDAVFRMNADWSELRLMHGKAFLADALEPEHDWLGRYIPPVDRSRVTEAVEKAVESGCAFELTHRVLRADGRVAWSHSRAVPRLNFSGEIVEWIGSAKDVTPRDAAGDTTSASESRFERLANGSPVLLWADQKGSCAYVSRAYREFVGDMSEDQVNGPDWSRFIHPEDRGKYVAAFTMALRTRAPFSAECRMRRFDGQWRWMRSEASAVDGSGDYVGATVDITDRKNAEAALRASEERFRRLVEVSSEITWVTNADGLAIEDSPSWRAFTGCTYEEWSGRNWLQVIHPEDRDRVAQAWRHAVETKSPYRVEFRQRHHSGEYRYMDCEAAPILNLNGTVREWIGMNRDVTERHRAEAEVQRLNHELQGRLDELQTMLEIMPVGVLRADKTCERITGNTAAYEMLGLPAGINVSVTAQTGRLEGVACVAGGRPLTPDELPMQKVGRTGQPLRNVEHDLVFADGRVRSLLCNVAPLLDRAGGIRGVVGVYADVTERKRTEEALRRSEEQLKLVSNTIPALISYVDASSRYRWCNRAYVKWFGLQDSEIVNHTMREVLGERVWKVIEPHFTAAMAGKPADFEAEAKYLHGGTRWIHAVYTPARDRNDRVVGVVVMVSDVTERKRAEDAVRQSEQRYRTLVSLITEVPWTTDANGAFAAPQPAWERYTGQTWEESRGFGWMNAFHPEDRDMVLERWTHCCGLQLLYHSESRIWHAASKQYRHCVNRATPVLRDDGTIREWIGCCTDVHESHEASKKLEGIVKERTAALQEKIGELEAFSYSISHDMRGPLRSMQGFSNALLEEYSGSLDDDARDYLRRINRGAQRLDLLVRDVLAYSKLAKGDFELGPVELSTIVNDVLQSLDTSQAEITVESPLPVVIGHSALLGQVFSNFLGNAVKFGKPGAKPNVRVYSRRGGDMVRVCVADDGIGIAPEHFSRIFEIFGRVHSDTKYEGTGIGLAIVKKAVERLGGNVGVDSEAGKGSCFWAEFRLHNREAAERV